MTVGVIVFIENNMVATDTGKLPTVTFLQSIFLGTMDTARGKGKSARGTAGARGKSFIFPCHYGYGLMQQLQDNIILSTSI